MKSVNVQKISFIERLAITYHDSGFLDDITIQLFLFLLGLKDEATRFKKFIDQNKVQEMSQLDAAVQLERESVKKSDARVVSS